MKRIFSVALFVLLVINFCYGGDRQKIIFDCDLGGDIDDAFAVAMMLTAQDVIELDNKALSNAKHIYSMFGDYHFGALEWNVRADIEASQVFIANIEASQVFIANIDNNITLSGVKVAGAIKWNDDRCQQVEDRDTPLTDALTELLRLWRSTRPEDNMTPILWDCTALGLVLWPELYETRKVYMSVDDSGHNIIDEDRDPNCEIAANIDVDEFRRRLMDLYMNQNFKRL